MLNWIPVKGVELLIIEFERYGPRKGYFGVVVALLFFFTVYTLELVGNGTWFKPWVRDFLGDYSYPVSFGVGYCNALG